MDKTASRFPFTLLAVSRFLFLTVLLAACSNPQPVEQEVFLEITPMVAITSQPETPQAAAPSSTSEASPTRTPRLEHTTAPTAVDLPTATADATQPASASLPTQLPETTEDPGRPASPIPADSPVPTSVPETVTTWPADGGIYGIELHALSDAGGLGLLTGSGAHWVRRNALLWSDVEYQPGERNWQNVARLEAELQAAAENNLNVILIVRSTPQFARQVASSACGPVAAEAFDDFADFMAEAVSRYSYPPYNVLYWEIGNEPDIDSAQMRSDSVYGCWGDQSAPFYGGEHYAEMLKVVYPQVKAANPQVQLLVGGLLLDCDPINPPQTSPGSGNLKDCTSGRYLEGILEAGGGAYFDAVSFHAYDYYGERLGRYGNLNWNSVWNTTGPVVSAKVSYLTDLLTHYGWQDKPLLNTEVALICASSPAVCAAEEFKLTKAYYAAQVNARALVTGVKTNLWYSLQGWRDSGLVEAGNTPNQAYQAFVASVERLSGAEYAEPIDLPSGLMGVAYDREGIEGWIVWAVDDGVHSLALAQAPDQVYDVFGEPLAPSNPLDVGVAPVYIEWSP